MPRATWVGVGAVWACSLLLQACGAVRSGYPGHNQIPSLADPSKPATDNKAMYLDLIRQMQQQGAYYASLAHIDAFRLHYGNPPQLQRLQADALRETGQKAAARQIYQAMLRGPQAAPAWHGLGLIAASDKQYEEAEKDLFKATQLEPINVTYLSDLGYARLVAGHIAAAHEPLAEAAELDPTNAKVIANLALWASLNGNASESEAIMQRANLPKETRDAVRRLALNLRMQSKAGDQATASSSGIEPTPTVPSSGIPSPLLGRLSSSSSSEAHP